MSSESRGIPKELMFGINQNNVGMEEEREREVLIMKTDVKESLNALNTQYDAWQWLGSCRLPIHCT